MSKTVNKLTLSVTETAALLGVSRPTVYTLIRREDFPAFKVGSRTLIPYSGLVAWVEKQSAPADVAASTEAEDENPVHGFDNPQRQCNTLAVCRQGGRYEPDSV